jgi:hypothetical protein
MLATSCSCEFHCLITVVLQKETRMPEHYEHVVVELLALATECDLRSSEIEPGYPIWKILGDNVMHAILKSTEGVISDSGLDWLADIAGERAVALVDSSRLDQRRTASSTPAGSSQTTTERQTQDVEPELPAPAPPVQLRSVAETKK